MDAVFLLWHTHDMGGGEIDDKLIGVYSSEAAAQAARQRKLQLEGFRDTPGGFVIDRCEIDRDLWAGGFAMDGRGEDRSQKN